LATTPHARPRPLSPHLSVWRWGPHMLVSIIHRALGVGMALVGAPLLAWFLLSVAGGAESYRRFRDTFTVDAGGLNIVGWVIGVGLTWAVLQHMATGVRHLVLDTGAGYELKRNKMGALATMAVSVVLTALFWFFLEMK
jgi:succinate dehydrogenase / fumarate reductase, cytochrome b subunit